MNIRLAEKSEGKNVLAFYYDVIDGIGEKNLPKWERGVYPTDDYIFSAIEKHEMYVGEEDGKIACATVLNHSINDGYDNVKWGVSAQWKNVLVVHILGVHPDFRGRGVAKALVMGIIKIAQAKKCMAIRLDVLSGNLPAAHTYESCGFRLVDMVKLFYEDTGWADFMMYEFIING